MKGLCFSCSVKVLLIATKLLLQLVRIMSIEELKTAVLLTISSSRDFEGLILHSWVCDNQWNIPLTLCLTFSADNSCLFMFSGVNILTRIENSAFC